MRTTVTLESDVEALLNAHMREHGLSFKRALNDAVRSGLVKPAPEAVPFRQRRIHLGRARVDLTKALSLAAELDDQKIGQR